MPWYAWVLIVLIALDPLAKVLLIGRPRDGYTPALAAASLIVAPLYIWAIVALANH